jgi:hypothetical protein
MTHNFEKKNMGYFLLALLLWYIARNISIASFCLLKEPLAPFSLLQFPYCGGDVYRRRRLAPLTEIFLDLLSPSQPNAGIVLKRG